MKKMITTNGHIIKLDKDKYDWDLVICKGDQEIDRIASGNIDHLEVSLFPTDDYHGRIVIGSEGREVCYEINNRNKAFRFLKSIRKLCKRG